MSRLARLLPLLLLGCAAAPTAAPSPPPNYFCRPVQADTPDGEHLFGLFCIPQKATPAAYHRGQLIAYDSANECAPSWLAMDPSQDTLGYSFSVLIQDAGGHLLWDRKWTFPIAARCKEARATVWELQKRLLIPTVVITECH